MWNTTERADVDGLIGAPQPSPTDGSNGSLAQAPSGTGPASDGTAPAVVVRHLSKTFHPSPAWMKMLLKSAIVEPVIALNDVSFEVRQGEICVVIGPNGAGKSTLFRILTGLTSPSSGKASIMGHDIEQGRLIRSMIGFMPAEDRNLMLRHTCAQNLAFRGKLHGIRSSELDDRVEQALDQTGILHARNQAATSLSTGMKARLQLAAALMQRPKVLILDEPTSAVDPVGAYELLTLIEQVTAELGLSVLISSHRLEEIDALENKVVLLDRGRVLHNGNLQTLRRLHERSRYRIEFRPDVDLEVASAHIRRTTRFDVTVVDGAIEVPDAESIGILFSTMGPLTDAISSIERTETPLRVLMHRLISGQIEGQR